MAWLGRIFGGKTPEPVVIEHNGFRIIPVPMKDAGQYRLSARVELDLDDETKKHTLIRVDSFQSLDAANEAAVAKAKQLIDQMGAKLFL